MGKKKGAGGVASAGPGSSGTGDYRAISMRMVWLYDGASARRK